MNITPEQYVAAQKAQLETLFGLSQTAFEGMEKLMALNLQVAKTSLTEAAETSQALLSVKDAQELMALQSSMLQPGTEKMAARPFVSRLVTDYAARLGAVFARFARLP
jgi:phasin family protein